MPLLLALGVKLSAATYYIDYAAGSDASAGSSTSAAWKHCPGDSAATGIAAGTTLMAGDTVLFKGGVSYVFTGNSGISLKWNGLPGSPISYDGNSSGAWGTGRAKFTDNYGSAAITAFSASTPASWLSFKSLEISALGGSASLPADSGSALAAKPGNALAFSSGATNVTIDNCVFSQLGYAFNQKPMAATSLSGSAVTMRGANSVNITNCDFSRMNLGIDLNGTALLTNVAVTNCAFHDSVVWPFNLPTNTSGVTISGCSEISNTQFDRAFWTGYGDSPRLSTMTVSAGSIVTLTASAAAIPSASFQWQKDGQPLSGASYYMLTLSSVSASDAGYYTAIATNSSGSTVSHEVLLTVTGSPAPVAVAPAITAQPVSQTVAPLSSVTFSVAASGSPAPTFQWFRNGAAISGATSATFTIASVATTDAASYTAVATNSAGSATSNAATLTVTGSLGTGSAPAFTTQPVSQTAAPMTSVTFTVTASGSPSYQWFRNGITFPGWNSATITLSGLSSNDEGTYVAVATNSSGSTTSSAATLTVATAPAPTGTAPAISTQPASQTVTAGANVTFTVAATGSPAPTLQWFKNSTAISGATSTTLSLANVGSTDAATYYAVATNSMGTAQSNNATLTVNAPAPTGTAPAITAQPISQTVTTGANVTFTVAATGSPAPTLQWFKNSTAISGATSTTLSLANVSSTDAATYYAVATNSLGTAQSSNATLTVNAPPSNNVAPVFTQQPVSVTANAKTNVTFSALASGTPTPTYQWKKDGAVISGATNRTLTLNNVSKGNAGNYTVVATNVAGSVTSNTAVLTVTNFKTAAATAASEEPAAPSAASRLANLSVRATAGSGDDSLIVGFVVSGDSDKSLLIRGSGPALSAFGVTGVLADPTLALYSGSRLLAANDDWSTSSEAAEIPSASQSVGAFALPEASRDAALLTSVAPGAYTGQITGKQDSTGTALIELYDVPGSDSRLVNVSVRTSVRADGAAPTIGFVVSGTEPKKLLIRAVGPSLATFGVSGTLANPQLEIYANGERVQQNDDWAGSAELNDVFGQVGAFPLADAASKDAAIIFNAAPGAYTAVVSGADNASGTVLVEVYEVR